MFSVATAAAPCYQQGHNHGVSHLPVNHPTYNLTTECTPIADTLQLVPVRLS